MKAAGTVSLCKRSGEVVDVKHYESRSKRHKILEQWAKIYVRRLNECHLIITPDTNELLVKENGENKINRG
jgi:hypothetical protein